MRLSIGTGKDSAARAAFQASRSLPSPLASPEPAVYLEVEARRDEASEHITEAEADVQEAISVYNQLD